MRTWFPSTLFVIKLIGMSLAQCRTTKSVSHDILIPALQRTAGKPSSKTSLYFGW